MMKIDAMPLFRRRIKKFNYETTLAVFDAMQMTAATFGQPHLHSGRGIREILPGLYECRAGLGIRLMFRRKGESSLFEFAGTHNEVKAWWKNKK